MKGRVLKAISILKVKNTQLSDCRIVGNEVWVSIGFHLCC